MSFDDPKLKFSMGFVCSPDGERVLLLQKNKPEQLKGQWMGVGGKIDPGEDALEAMVRECREETGLEISAENWLQTGIWHTQSGRPIYFFVTKVGFDDYSKLSDTGEAIKDYSWDEVSQLRLSDSTLDMCHSIENLARNKTNEVTFEVKAAAPKTMKMG